MVFRLFQRWPGDVRRVIARAEQAQREKAEETADSVESRLQQGRERTKRLREDLERAKRKRGTREG